MNIYTVEERTIFMVMARKGPEQPSKVIAKCISEGTAETIKGMYEKAEREAKIEESDNQLHG